MEANPKTRQTAFKDYCLILQVHPEADTAMIDTAYWHLARRYQDAAPTDASARAKLDELNEAYAVLGSAERREEYIRRRNEALGDGALPVRPSLPPPPPPLAVMVRQHPSPPNATPRRIRTSWLGRLLRGRALRLPKPRLMSLRSERPRADAADTASSSLEILERWRGAQGVEDAPPATPADELPPEKPAPAEDRLG